MTESAQSNFQYFEALQQMDATDYLSHVSREANALPDHFDAPTHNTNHQQHRQRLLAFPTGSAAALQYLVERSTLTPPPTPAHLPVQASAWIEQTLEQFTRLRSYLESLRQQGVGGKQDPQRIKLPAMKDAAAWLAFCVGADAALGNDGAYFHDDESDDDQTQQSTWLAHPPTASILLQMDQVMVRAVVGHLAVFVTQGWSPRLLAPWIYGLLARLETPVHRDDASRLYKLLKYLAEVRTTLPVHSPELAPINLIVTIIAIYMEQGNPLVMQVPPRPSSSSSLPAS